MDRRKFLRLIPATVTAVVIAPKLLIPKEGESVWSPEVQKGLKNRISTIRMNPMQIYEPRDYSFIAGCDPVIGNDYQNVIILKNRKGSYTWMVKAELDFAKVWEKQREIALMQYNYYYSMMNIQSYIK